MKNFRTAPGEAGTPPKPGNEIAAVIRCLTEIKPDVLGLVEMGSREDLALLQKQLNAGGVNLPESEWLEGADPDRHLAVLSRFPILRTTSHPDLTYLLDETRHPMQRGILDVTLAVTPDYQFRLLGAHLKSQRGTAAADEEMMRRNEARLLRKTLDRILGEEPEANLLLFGDFNCTRDNAAMRDIRGLAGSPGGLSLVTASDRWGHRWTHYYPVEDSYSRIDFFLQSRGLVPEIVAGSGSIAAPSYWDDASDHRAISVLVDPARSAPPAKPTRGHEKNSTPEKEEAEEEEDR